MNLRVNGIGINVVDGTTVAAAIMNSGITAFRTSVSDGPRGPLCGMGICFECRVTIDGAAGRTSCNTLVTEGMEVTTAE